MFWSATTDQKENCQLSAIYIFVLKESDNESFKENRKRRAIEFRQYSVSLISVFVSYFGTLNSRMDKKSPIVVPHQQERTVKWCGWLAVGEALKMSPAIQSLTL